MTSPPAATLSQAALDACQGTLPRPPNSHRRNRRNERRRPPYADAHDAGLIAAPSPRQSRLAPQNDANTGFVSKQAV